MKRLIACLVMCMVALPVVLRGTSEKKKNTVETARELVDNANKLISLYVRVAAKPGSDEQLVRMQMLGKKSRLKMQKTKIELLALLREARKLKRTTQIPILKNLAKDLGDKRKELYDSLDLGFEILNQD